ncbi:hypothetical protein BofuT4_P003370.1 [Botrytis cinerea T4]|uniref:Uncharacterized protein n=1 Tax=Botryotinia fuckeliana (strain T4) TaxID=999810 RepID=G2Y3D8_BOTF4|nr:hypothetical protein BofuT4_P003370.1 [Botrytis cinerea T4]
MLAQSHFILPAVTIHYPIRPCSGQNHFATTEQSSCPVILSAYFLNSLHCVECVKTEIRQPTYSQLRNSILHPGFTSNDPRERQYNATNLAVPEIERFWY